MQSKFGGRVLNSNSVGTGKSLETLLFIHKYLPKDPPGPVVIVPPAHLKINWSREILKHTGQRSFICYHERVPPETLPPEDPNSILICNYNILVPPRWRSRMAFPPDSWAAWLKNLKPRMVVADEGHALKDIRSQRTRAFKKMVEGVEYVHILTGTPITNQPGDLWPLLNILRPDLYRSQWEFLNHHSHLRRYWWGWRATGAKDLDLLHEELSRTVMIRRRKEDVLEDLPPVTYSTVPIEVDLRDYRKAEGDFLGWMEKEFPTKARNAAKAEQLSKLNFLKQMVGQLKVKAVISLIEDYLESTDGKILLGAIHHSVTKPLMEALGGCAVLVNGKLTDKQKNEAFDLFNSNKKCRVLVGNLQAAGTGWSCQATSNIDIMEMPWVPSDIIQFIGRCDGINRGIPGTGASVRFLLAPNTIDDDLAKANEVKQKWANEAIDGCPDAMSLPVHQMVLEAMRRRHGNR